VRHGTTNLFAALNVAIGAVDGECKPSRDGATFRAFLRKAVQPHVPAAQIFNIVDTWHAVLYRRDQLNRFIELQFESSNAALRR